MKQKKRISSFDGLKGLAILLVVLYHLLPKQVPGGFLMVNTFFVLAGYFYVRKLEAIGAGTDTFDWAKLGHYLRHTFIRLFVPLVFFMMILLAGLFVFNPVELHFIGNDVWSSSLFVNNFYQILAGRSYFVKMADASPFTHLWYSALYLQFFLVAIPLFYLTKRLKMNVPQKAIFWLLLMFASHVLVAFLFKPGQDPSRVYYGLETRFASFAAGISVAYFTPTVLNFFHNMVNKLMFYTIMGTLSFISMLWLCLNALDKEAFTYLVWMPTFNMLSLLVVFAIVIGIPIIRKGLSFKPLTYLGKRSYSYYLWYYPVTVFVSKNIRLIQDNRLAVLIALVLIWLIGDLFYRLVEKDQWGIWFGPSLNFKQDWAKLKDHIKPNFKMDADFGKFLVSCVIFILFLAGAANLRNHQRPALFQLEYQEYLTSHKMEKVFPQAVPLIEVHDQLAGLDKKYQSSFIQKEQQTGRQLIDNMLSASESNMAELQRAIEENRQEVDALREKSPEMAAVMSPYEIAFAAKTPVFLFGDSQARRTGDFLVTAFTKGDFYGKVSLQIWDALPIFQEYVQSGQVAENVVVILGTNLGLDQESVDEFMKIAGDRQVFWVNTNSAVDHLASVNKIIQDTADKYSNAHVVDWYSYSQGHPEWYAEDDIHFSVEGCNEFVGLVARTMMEALNQKQQ
ncbi:acyltransferase family protein [Vaginisenegalia massiliensis]|uniref:acyltransferase family protein n=1 Tax=Vaginisenegalia massiliensis TaxID=2058294 RepID=UPI000F5352C7|nr:acyltransferase family protein [Vaginisenegalia massiliensis]